jgi:sporulation protein YlmC with PRC-barrel domain
MADKDKIYSKELLGKTIVSKSGKKFGEVGDLVFEVGSGELIHIVLRGPTSYIDRIELEKTKDGEILIPFSAVIATGDYIVVAEEDII